MLVILLLYIYKFYQASTRNVLMSTFFNTLLYSNTSEILLLYSTQVTIFTSILNYIYNFIFISKKSNLKTKYTKKETSFSFQTQFFKGYELVFGNTKYT